MSAMQPCELEQILRGQVQTLSATLRPATIAYYRVQLNGFFRYLHLNHPEINSCTQLQRNPHILGWLRSLAESNPRLTNRSRRAALICMRRLFEDLADNGYPIGQTLIWPQDLPPRDIYLPIPVSPEVDSLLSHELQKTDDLLSNALLLIRATGMRVGECLRLNRDSLRHLGGNSWALHVPLGKLHTERLVPLDDDGRKIFDRILSLAGPAPPDTPNRPSPLLLLPSGKRVYYGRIRVALADAAKRADCPPVRLHQLRHTYATAMLRAGISLTALKEILGHRDIRMTMGYVQVTQTDLQREYHLARQKMSTTHPTPRLQGASARQTGDSRIADICGSLDAIRHQMEMYRRQVTHKSKDQKLHSLLRRLAKFRKELAIFLQG